MTKEEAIKRLEDMRKSAVVVLDSGFGSHPGESEDPRFGINECGGYHGSYNLYHLDSRSFYTSGNKNSACWQWRFIRTNKGD